MDLIKLSYIDVFDNNKEKILKINRKNISKDTKEGSLFVLCLDGKSMEPKIEHKSILVINLANKNLKDKGIYLLRYDNKMWLKLYNEKSEEFISINKDFSHLVYQKQDVQLVGSLELFFKR